MSCPNPHKNNPDICDAQSTTGSGILDLGPNWDVWVFMVMILLEGCLTGEIESEISYSSVEWELKLQMHRLDVQLDFSNSNVQASWVP